MKKASCSEFVCEAARRLCGPSSRERAVAGFWEFLGGHLPVTSMILGHVSPQVLPARVIARCLPGRADLPGGKQPVASSRIRQLSEIPRDLLARADSRRGLHIESAGHPMAAFAAAAASPRLAPAPLFMLRLREGDRIFGSAVFFYSGTNPFNGEHLEKLRALRLPLLVALRQWEQTDELRESREKTRGADPQRMRPGVSPRSEIIGAEGGLRRVMEMISRAGPAGVPVLISGETGTGKEIIAKAVHGLSSRSGRPFVAVNCGGIPPSLVDSELFGHVRGAFTGAVSNRKGRFERAHGGTIFLDEIGELPLDAQSRLLRVLQEGVVERVGGGAPVPVDFRLISATNRDLLRMIGEGRFREDLYYRLRVVCIRIPPLRERRRDIPLLADHLLRRAARRFGIPPPPLGDGEIARLAGYSWPGNVRELRNMLEEALVLAPEGPLRFRLEDGKRREEREEEELPRLDENLAGYFRRLLKSCGGRIGGPGGAAERAGLNPNTLRSRLDRLGVPYRRRKNAPEQFNFEKLDRSAGT
jgi:DNA-binding NtrC family response regulator